MRWRRNPEVVWRVAPDYLALATTDDHVVEARGAAPEIWLRLADWIDEDALARGLARDFGTDDSDLPGHVRTFLVTLQAEGFVHAEG